MDTIIQNLQTPSWWFTGIFFVVIAIVISKFFKLLPLLLKGVTRKILKRHLIKIKNMRQNKYDIMYQINSENRYYFSFIIIGSLYVLLFTLSPFHTLLKDHFWFGMILTSPIYIAEIAWLNKKGFIESLIKSSKKMGVQKTKSVKKKSNKPSIKKMNKQNKKLNNNGITRHLNQGLT